jgi:hypothetical protein
LSVILLNVVAPFLTHSICICEDESEVFKSR